MKKNNKSNQIQICLLLIMIALAEPALLNAQWNYWTVMEQQYGVAAVSDAKNGERSLSMQNNDKNFLVSYTGSYVDLVVPGSVNYDHLRFEVRGADGGSRINNDLIVPFKTKGGGGALIKGYLKIGTGENEVPPGSTVRMIIGLSGGTFSSSSTEGAAGGGGTGLFFKKPGDNSWQTVAVAGGGGGLNTAMENGEPKGSWADLSEPLNLFSSGKDYFGCGHGQKDQTFAGGGGGGYSGGSDGSAVKSSGGGGSYINNAWVYFNEITINPSTNSPMAGSVVFQLTNDAPEISTIQFAFNTSKCIDDYGSGTSNGNNIQTYTCTDHPNQQWYFKTEDRTVHSMVNYNKCLDLSNGNTSNGANIQLWDCVGGNANQHWVYNGLYKTIHSGKNSDKCLDANGGSQYPNSNVNVQLWDCNYLNNNQKWNIDGAATVADVTFKKHIVPVLATSSAVHSHTGAVSGSNIQLWTKDDSNEYEQWFFEGLAIKMRNHRELCIDLSSSNTDNGNNIQLYNCNGSNAQKWLYDGMTKSIRSVVNPDKCMQIEYNTDGAYGKRSNVNIYDCNGSDVQQFLIQE